LFENWNFFILQCSYNVENADFAIKKLAQTTMRSEIGKITLDTVFREREILNVNIVGKCPVNIVGKCPVNIVGKCPVNIVGKCPEFIEIKSTTLCLYAHQIWKITLHMQV
jgi:hypothetical protein